MLPRLCCFRTYARGHQLDRLHLVLMGVTFIGLLESHVLMVRSNLIVRHENLKVFWQGDMAMRAGVETACIEFGGSKTTHS